MHQYSNTNFIALTYFKTWNLFFNFFTFIVFNHAWKNILLLLVNKVRTFALVEKLNLYKPFIGHVSRKSREVARQFAITQNRKLQYQLKEIFMFEEFFSPKDVSMCKLHDKNIALAK